MTLLLLLGHAHLLLVHHPLLVQGLLPLHLLLLHQLLLLLLLHHAWLLGYLTRRHL